MIYKSGTDFTRSITRLPILKAMERRIELTIIRILSNGIEASMTRTDGMSSDA